MSQQQIIINPNVIKAQYAVRGEIVIKADEYRAKLSVGEKLPFDKVIACNIGNPLELQPTPVTFFRQVIALCQYPDLMTNPDATKAFPADAISRAQHYLSHMSSMGAYSHSKGLKVFREEIAQSIELRDGYKADPEQLFLTNGASAAVTLALQLLIAEKGVDGVMVPIPQYPLYSATLQLLEGQLVPYYLEEKQGWGLTVEELESQYNAAVKRGVHVKAVTIINPGNPTGGCLTEQGIKDIVKWCEEKKLTILSDEVYQANIYNSAKPFVSFHRVVNDLKSTVPLISFHSASKGVVGECGGRGGYGHWINFPQQVIDEVYKLSSIGLCANLTGQLLMALISMPPKAGDESYELYHHETQGQLESLQRRAIKLATALNTLEGVSCQPIDGALYAFPQITLSENAQKAAKELGKTPDTMYCLQLLDQTGIICVSGSGFLQVSGTFHFRMTILPPENDMDIVITRITQFHQNFMARYQ